MFIWVRVLVLGTVCLPWQPYVREMARVVLKTRHMSTDASMCQYIIVYLSFSIHFRREDDFELAPDRS